MSGLTFWQQKLVQLLHDPPAKAFFLRPGVGGHKGVAAKLFEAVSGVPLTFARGRPDYAAAGADRPVLSPPSRTKGASTIHVDWVSSPVVTHPLAAGASGSHAIHFGDVERPTGRAQIRELGENVAATLDQLLVRRDSPEGDLDEGSGAAAAAAPADDANPPPELAKLPLWNDERALREACLQLWRRWPTPEGAPDGLAETLWAHQPADSRAPDHSLWDHLRVTSALAFVGGAKREGARMPWLLAFSLGPVQSFIARSRTSRDLWTSSMLLSDLIWHAMMAFVERYGPEAIVYPDLRGNPRADLWLWEQWRETLPPGCNPCSYAGIFPNTFIALVPRGGGGGLDLLENVAAKARQRVESRWSELAALAKRYFLAQASARGHELSEEERVVFDRTWSRQHEHVLFTTWSAAAWPAIEGVEDLQALAIRQALPAQAPPPPVSERDHHAVRAWHARHAPWIPSDAFARYADVRHVYAQTDNGVHRMERGFDYPLVHHALHVRHNLHKAEAGSPKTDGAGEKCTLCGDRQALGARDGGEREHVDMQRARLREFWQRFDPDSEEGAERLCAVCTMKRVLIHAGVERASEGVERMVGLTAAWAGPATDLDDVRDRDRRLRVPFPSTATVAAQAFLCEVVTNPALREEMSAVEARCDEAGLSRTTFVRALRSLADAAAAADQGGRCFLEYEAEMTVFPADVATAEQRAQARVEDPGRRTTRQPTAAALGRLREAVVKLRAAAADPRRMGEGKGIRPGTQVALLALDGDGIRKLLLGQRVGARWRDVIHPDAVQKLESNAWTQAAGWPALLDRTRVMGPSTHAFVNRVLAAFAHTIVPWVVEREFSGRLIYAGGDDVLALAPAGEALDIAARLAQLYSAAWVIDTTPEEEPWSWRQRNASPPSARAADRFVVVEPGDEPLRWPIALDRTHAPVGAWSASGGTTNAARADGRLLAMLGAGQTLSAGIAFGHYKTPLGALVRAAWEERDRAKGKRLALERGVEAGTSHGNAFSICRFTRSGEKARLQLAWGESGGRPKQALAGYLRARSVIKAFRDGTVPARAPYKLREVEEAVAAAWSYENNAPTNADDMRPPPVERVRHFARGLFDHQISASGGVRDAVFALWWEGLQCALGISAVAADSVGDEHAHARGRGSEQGLAVCRFLAGLEEEP